MTTAETKTAAIALVVAIHAEVQSFFGSLSGADLARPVYGEGEGWRIRDLVAHLALWQSVSTRVAQKIARVDALPDTDDWDIWAGELTPTPELNRRIFLEWKDRPVADALAHLAAVNAGLVQALEQLRPEHIAAGDTLHGDLHPYLRAPGVRHARAHLTHARSAVETGPSVDAKERALADFERTHREMDARLRALSPASLTRPIWTGEGDGWRVQDLVPHIASWYRIAARAARLIAWGTEPPPEAEMRLREFTGIAASVDELNREQFGAWRARDRAECFTELDAAHAELLHDLRSLPAARVVKPDGQPYRYFWQPALNHLLQHREHLEAALKETATT